MAPRIAARIPGLRVPPAPPAIPVSKSSHFPAINPFNAEARLAFGLMLEANPNFGSSVNEIYNTDQVGRDQLAWWNGQKSVTNWRLWVMTPPTYPFTPIWQIRRILYTPLKF